VVCSQEVGYIFDGIQAEVRLSEFKVFIAGYSKDRVQFLFAGAGHGVLDVMPAEKNVCIIANIVNVVGIDQPPLRVEDEDTSEKVRSFLR